MSTIGALASRLARNSNKINTSERTSKQPAELLDPRWTQARFMAQPKRPFDSWPMIAAALSSALRVRLA